MASLCLIVCSFTFLFFLVGYNSWLDHVSGWWEHKDNPNILLLKYKDVKKVSSGVSNQAGAPG